MERYEAELLNVLEIDLVNRPGDIYHSEPLKSLATYQSTLHIVDWKFGRGF
jgi:hypothetical protein